MSKRPVCDGDENVEEAAATKRRAVAASLSPERLRAEALMLACIERLGVQSPAALAVCDTYLAHDLWMNFVHQDPVGSQVWGWESIHKLQSRPGFTEEHTPPTEVTALHGRCIHAVACGYDFTMAVVDDGELWATDDNGNGRLGPEDTGSRNTFTRVSGLSGRKVTAVACGDYHTLALLESGELFAWGWNNYGQLGLGDTNIRWTPEPVAALSDRRVVAIACGGTHSVASLESGELFAWGRNYHGQLGLGDHADRNVPTQVAALAKKRVVTVACGQYDTAAVLETGELFTWGCNNCDQLGHGDRTMSKRMPQLVEAFRGRPVAAVACHTYHTLALLKTGEVFGWGCNEYGQLGLGKFSGDPVRTPQQVHFFDNTRVRSVHCGVNCSGVVLKTGELFVWGYIEYLQLGAGCRVSRMTYTPTAKLTGKHVLSVALGTKHTHALVE